MKPHAHEATRITGPRSVCEASAEPLLLPWGQFEYVYYSGEAAPNQTYPAAGCELFHYLLTQQIKRKWNGVGCIRATPALLPCTSQSLPLMFNPRSSLPGSLL